VRALAVGEVRLRDWWVILRRELVCGVALGLFLGSIGLARVVLWHRAGWADFTGHYFSIGLTVSGAVAGVVLWGTVVGSMLPFILRRLGLDPATSSAPFVATLVDVTGLLIYFGTAMALLRNTLL
jgi:magnesium transporter